MIEFIQQAGFFVWHLFRFMVGFYVVWVPGFLLAGLLTCRFRRQAWNRVVNGSESNLKAVFHAIGLGMTGSAGRKRGLEAMLNLLRQGASPASAFASLIASRNMTIHFWSIFALSLGAEFATGHLLGSLVMIGLVTLGLQRMKLQVVRLPQVPDPRRHPLDSPHFPSWRSLLFSFQGWRALFTFFLGEVASFAPSLAVGILLGGTILAAGLRPWWVEFAAPFGEATILSDVTNAVLAPVLSVVAFLSPVGNLPVIHALFKTGGLNYPGIISFCLASVIHPRDVKTYIALFGRKQTWAILTLFYGSAVFGGLGSLWIYGAFGFRPNLPPIKIGSKILDALLGLL